MQSILECCDQTGSTHFWPCPPKKCLINFYFKWICINMQKISLFYLFWRYGWSKTPAIWLLRTFWPISQEQKISQVQNLNRKKSNNINFHYWSNLIKINEQIFQQIKKTLLLAHFGPIFQILRLKKMFPENLALPHSTSHAILKPY